MEQYYVLYHLKNKIVYNLWFKDSRINGNFLRTFLYVLIKRHFSDEAILRLRFLHEVIIKYQIRSVSACMFAQCSTIKILLL